MAMAIIEAAESEAVQSAAQDPQPGATAPRIIGGPSCSPGSVSVRL